MQTTFYVYAYLDPRKPGNYTYGKYHFKFEPFYIGLGHDKRMFSHLQPSILKRENTRKKNKIKKLINLGFDLRNGFIVKIEDGLDRQQSKQFEILAIKTIGRLDDKSGPLTNNTDGGDGAVNLTKEARDIISKTHMGNKYSLGRKQSKEEIEKRVSKIRGKPSWNKGIPKSDEARANQSLSQKGINTWSKGRKITQEHKDKISKTQTGMKRKPGSGENISKSLIGKKKSKEHVRKMAIARRFLSDDQIKEIYNKYWNDKIPQKQMMEMYKISKGVLYNITRKQLKFFDWNTFKTIT